MQMNFLLEISHCLLRRQELYPGRLRTDNLRLLHWPAFRSRLMCSELSILPKVRNLLTYQPRTWLGSLVSQESSLRCKSVRPNFLGEPPRLNFAIGENIDGASRKFSYAVLPCLHIRLSLSLRGSELLQRRNTVNKRRQRACCSYHTSRYFCLDV